MRTGLFIAATVTAIVAAIGAAGTSSVAAAQEASEGMDFDTLAACSVVYQQVGHLYGEQGEAAKSLEFAQAANAYAASGLHMLGHAGMDAEAAMTYADTRMEEIVGALNDASRADPDGDMGVIGEWLPFCDELGASVSQTLVARDRRGW